MMTDKKNTCRNKHNDPNADKVGCWGNFNKSQRCAECELRQPCQSKTDEPKENLRYHFQHVSVPHVFFDGAEKEGLDEKIIEAALEYHNLSTEDNEPADLQLDGLTIPEELIQIVYKVIDRLADFYFHTPHVFEAIMKRSMQGKSQSDIARENHITRQCVNKRLLRDLNIAQKRNDIQQRRDRELAEAKADYTRKTEELRQKDEFLQSLSERNWMIYKLHFIDGCSEESTAKQLGCCRRTVSSVAQFLRENLAGNCTNVKRGRKKNGKNNKKFDPRCC